MPENGEIRVITFQSGEFYIAQGLELDICTQGKTEEEATKRFFRVLRAEMQHAVENGTNLFDIGPAPQKFFSLYSGSPDTGFTAKVA